jgi:hypothetical protein
MQIEDFKTWHWVAIGLVVGLLYSAVLTMAGPWFDAESLDTIDLASFEHGAVGQLTHHDGPDPRLLEQFHAGQPVMADLVVHPPLRNDPQHYWVTGKLYSIKPEPKGAGGPTTRGSTFQVVEQWRPFKYPADIPFVADFGLPGLETARRPAPKKGAAAKPVTATLTFATVIDYLAATTHVPAGANVRFRFAWQELPIARWTLPPVAGLLIIGIAWPLALGAMQSIGMARPPAVVKKPKPAPEPVPTTKPVTGVSLAPPPPPPPVPAPELHPDDKDYRGEFYPVVKPAHHE